MLHRRRLIASGLAAFAAAASGPAFGYDRYYYGPPRWRRPPPDLAPPEPSLDLPRREPAVPTPEHGEVVTYIGNDAPGTVLVDTADRCLYLVLDRDTALQYAIGVGREGFSWHGEAVIGRKAKWPDWHPTASMRERDPSLPERMEGGPSNPLGARALYLYQNGKDTLYRIHGTNEPSSIGQAASSGCIRMLNAEVEDLYARVEVGAPVVVLPHDARPLAREDYEIGASY